MSEFVFTPDRNHQQIEVPYFEDARADFAPYYDIRNKSIADCQSLVSIEMGKLGGIVTGFMPGTFGTGKVKRYGIELRFVYGNAPGIIRVAALPFRDSATAKKIERARIQALLNVRDWLKSAVTSQVFSPGSDVLIPFLLVDGEHTIADYVTSTGNLPRLNPPAENIIEGEVVIS